jgi:Domain of unknown function (DUF397)
MTPVWRKSSRSGSNAGQSDCVEVANLTGNIGVRDSKNPTGPILTFDRAQLGRFLVRIKNDEI